MPYAKRQHRNDEAGKQNAEPVPAPGAELTVGPVDHPAEHAADEAAQAVLQRLRRLPESTLPGSDGRPPASGGPPVVGPEGGAVPADVGARIEARRGRGRPLDPELRAKLEDGFGTGLGAVRIHADGDAARLSQALGARAFTTGSDVFFAPGAFRPDTHEGQHVLAHELAHTLQERGGSSASAVRRSGKKTPEEKEAEQQRKAKEQEEKPEAAKEKKAAQARKKEHKKTEKTEKARIAGERKRGSKKRAQLMEGMDFESGRPEDRKAELDAQFAMNQALKARFDAKLKEEAQLRRRLLLQNLDKGKEWAEAEAYEKVWLNLGPQDEDLRALRPQRETSAERLMREIDRERAEYRSRHEGQKVAAKELKTDRLVPKKVGKAYEELVQLLDHRREEIMRSDTPLSEGQLAERQAEWEREEAKTVGRFWAAKDRDESIAEGRPVIGSRLDRKAREEARRRVVLRKRKIALTENEAFGATKQGKQADAHGVSLASKVVGGVGGVAELPGKAATIGGIGAKVPVLVSTGTGKAGGPDFLGDTPDHYVNASSGFCFGLGAFISDIWSTLNHLQDVSRIFTDEAGYKNVDLWAEAVDAGTKAFKVSIDALKASAQVVQMALPAAEAVVANVIPGLGIAAGLANLVSDTMYLTAAGMRLGTVNNNLAQARRQVVPNKINPVVYPLIKLQKNYAEDVAKHSINIGLDMTQIAADTAQIASAGGYGVPAVIKAAAGVVKFMHGFSHFIAGNVLAAQAAKARKDWGIKHEEGAAEALLSGDNSFAVDAIIVLAKKRQDPVAISLLESYHVTKEDIATKDTYDLHKKMMRDMKADEDPKWIGPALQEKYEQVNKLRKRFGRKGRQVDEMYEERKKLYATGDATELGSKAGKDIGNKAWWVSKMYLKAMFDNTGFVASKHKTETQIGHELMEDYHKQKEIEGNKRKVVTAFLSGEKGTAGMGADFICKVGNHYLTPAAAEDEQIREEFLKGLNSVPIEELEKAVVAEYHTDDWKMYLRIVLEARLQDEAEKNAKASAG